MTPAKRRRARLPLITGLALLSGCAAPLDAFERTLEDAGIASFTPKQGRVVAVRGAGASGRGAVVGPRDVLTVAHVVRGQQDVWVATNRSGSGWVRARVVQRVRSWPEPLVLVRLPVQHGLSGSLLGFTGFSARDRFRAAPPGAAAARVHTARGRRAWQAGLLRPGDSGSPVVDATGRLVGLVSGKIGGQEVYAALREEQLLQLARR